jgi:hypothetical protein
MSKSKSGDTNGRYSEVCGATNRDGEPCQLPAGWGTPGSGGDRCKFHGGASTGPDSTAHLAGNDHADGNAGGGAPEGNTNAKTHGGFADWEQAYERFDRETRAWVDRLWADMRERAKRHAPEVSEARRERLLKEKATRTVLERRASVECFTGGDMSGDGPGRGWILTEERKVNGTVIEREKVNPAFEAKMQHATRQRKIAEELSLWPGFQD